MSYTITSGHDCNSVLNSVNDYVRHGWKLYGPLHVTALPGFGYGTYGSHQDGYIFYTQALIKDPSLIRIH